MQMHVVHESPGSERGRPDDGRLIAESWRVPERFGVVFDRHAAAIHGYIAGRLAGMRPMIWSARRSWWRSGGEAAMTRGSRAPGLGCTASRPGSSAGAGGMRCGSSAPSWTTADSGKAAYLWKGKVVLMPFPRCVHSAGCQSIGQPVPATLPDGQGQVVIGDAGKIPVSYIGLSSLPRSPVALDRYLAGLPLRGWGPAPVREFEVIKELLTTYVMPPALTAELYRALGNIPGVTVDHDAVDAAGRRGIGFQITLPQAA
jgi:hypothetical protein